MVWLKDADRHPSRLFWTEESSLKSKGLLPKLGELILMAETHSAIFTEKPRKDSSHFSV